MSMYVATSEEPGDFLCSNTGWSQFCKWARGLEDSPDLKHLCNFGWDEDVKDVGKQIKAGEPEGDVAGIADTLLKVIADGPDVLIITNGMAPGGSDDSADN